MADITLRLQPRGKPVPRLPAELPVSPDATTEELYKSVSKLTGYSVHRLRITRSDNSHLKPSSTSVADSSIYDQSSVFVKDLGPQLSWRTVFLLEYLGPLLLHPLTVLLRRQIYSVYPPIWQWTASPLTTPATTTQLTLLTLITLHYTKRELETLYIHRFSAATMPLPVVVRNVAYYWALGGVFLSYFLYMPTKYETAPAIRYAAIAVWIFAQLSNFKTHLTLRDLRKPGSKDRGIPRGYGFELVTCPNYMFEVLGWIAVTVISGFQVPAIVFLGAGVFIQSLWAGQKERRYRKEFGERYKRKRWTILPGLW